VCSFCSPIQVFHSLRTVAQRVGSGCARLATNLARTTCGIDCDFARYLPSVRLASFSFTLAFVRFANPRQCLVEHLHQLDQHLA
jgi:hypothetical protein